MQKSKQEHGLSCLPFNKWRKINQLNPQVLRADRTYSILEQRTFKFIPRIRTVWSKTSSRTEQIYVFTTVEAEG